MHSKLRAFRDQSGGFAGAVSAPGFGLQEFERSGPEMPIVEVKPQSAQAVPSDAGSALILQVSDLKLRNPELQERRSALLGALIHLLGRLDRELLAPARLEAREDLLEQHREIREQGRAQQGICSALEIEFGQCNSRWNAARADRDQAIEAVRVAEYGRSHLNRFASDSEIAAADRKLKAAKDKASSAVNAEGAALHARNQAEEKLFTARNEFARIAADEVRLRAAIEGRTIKDPEFGLPLTPSPAA